MIKKLCAYSSLLVAVISVTMLSACESGFEEMNVNPTQAESIHPRFLLPTIELSVNGMGYDAWRGNAILTSAFVQHFSNTYYSGDKYLRPSDDWGSATWRVAYNGDGDTRFAPVKNVQHLIANHQDDPTMANYVAAGRVLRVFIFQRLTDMYGDIPYFQGGKGILEDDITPAYDPQSEIYADMLKELEEAAAQFDASLPLEGDLVYGGDVARWERFTYSMMLRLGMRLVKVDQGAAQNWVQKAIAGGVMQSFEDAAYVAGADGPSTGPNGLNSNGLTGYTFSQDSPLLTEFLVDWMQSMGDPRLSRIGAMYDGNAHQGAAVVSTNPDEFVGWPVGNDGTTIQTHPAFKETIGESFAQPGPFVRQNNDPKPLQTYAEVEFLLAEAAVRGWHTGDPAEHYERGVRAAMQWLSLFDSEGGTTISTPEVDAYLAANPYDPARALEQINTQYWAATFLNGYEAYANYRRSGYPVLPEPNWPGNETGGKVPRRVPYPTLEAVLNTENYNAAVQRQGPDDMTTRVWWDVPE